MTCVILAARRIAAVGPATANKLKELHLQVDLMPDEALAANIAQEFAGFESVENLRDMSVARGSGQP